MAQFDVHRNRNAATRSRFPFLLDVQSDLLDPLATRVVVPLSAAASARSRSMQMLTPVLRIDGKDYLLLTPQLAGIAVGELGAVAVNVREESATILAALDLLITGI